MEAKEIQSVKNQRINIDLKNEEDNQLIILDDQGRRTSQCHRAMALVVFLPRLEAML